MSAFHRACNDPVGEQSTRIGKVTMFTSASSRPRHVGPTGGRRCINTRRPTLLCRFVVDGPTSFWRQIVIGPASSRCLFVTWVCTLSAHCEGWSKPRFVTNKSTRMEELDENLDVVKLIFNTRFFQQKLVVQMTPEQKHCRNPLFF